MLAGGLGTRLRSVVSDVPKPMAPVGKRPFLERLVEYWTAQGIRRFVFSVGYLADTIERHFGARWGGAEIAYAREEAPLGTGGGTLLALSKVHAQQVVVLNGDTFFAIELPHFAGFHEERSADCSIALFKSDDVQRYLGVELAKDGRIAGFGAGNRSEGTLVNGGVYLFRAEALRQVPWRAGERLGLEADVLGWGIANGWNVYGCQFSGSFIDIGVPEDYARAPTVLGSS